MQRRAYDTALVPLTANDSADHHGCWFRFGSNQVMRNVALARTLVSDGSVDSAVVALCAPLAHRAIWRRWAGAKERLVIPGVKLVDLPAEAVVHHHANPTPMAQRYLLDLAKVT